MQHPPYYPETTQLLGPIYAEPGRAQDIVSIARSQQRRDSRHSGAASIGHLPFFHLGDASSTPPEDNHAVSASGIRQLDHFVVQHLITALRIVASIALLAVGPIHPL